MTETPRRRGRAGEATDDRSFEQWVRPHWPAMRRVAERLAGPNHRDDVLQEALAAAWHSRERFDPARGSPRTWLLAITANHARKALRSAWRHEGLEDVPGPATSAERVDIERAVHALPHRQRLAVELCYFVGVRLDEAAAVMGCAEGTVKSTLSAARANLRSTLGEDYR